MRAAETLELGDTCLIRLPERQWSPAPELPAAAEAAIAARGGERPSAVGILRDAFTPYDEPEMPLSQVPHRLYRAAPALPQHRHPARSCPDGIVHVASGVSRCPQMLFKTSEASLALAAPLTRAHARVHVDHYMFDKQAGVYRLLFNSQDLLQYLPQVRRFLAAPLARAAHWEHVWLSPPNVCAARQARVRPVGTGATARMPWRADEGALAANYRFMCR